MIQSKRVALSLKPDIDLVISDLARLTKQTKTSVINGILKDMYPVLKKTAFAIQKAQEGETKLSISLMQDVMSDAEKSFRDSQIELNGLGESNGNK